MTVVSSDPTASLTDYPYLRTLNPAQREAVLTTDGPVLVLAVPGRARRRR